MLRVTETEMALLRLDIMKGVIMSMMQGAAITGISDDLVSVAESDRTLQQVARGVADSILEAAGIVVNEECCCCCCPDSKVQVEIEFPDSSSRCECAKWRDDYNRLLAAWDRYRREQQEEASRRRAAACLISPGKI